MYATPTVVGDQVFIGSCAGTFYALDLATGETRWSYDIRKDGNQISFHGDPLPIGRNILIGTDLGCAVGAIGHVYAFDQVTGEVAWKHRGEGFPTNLVPIGRSVCFGTIRRDWGCISAATGSIAWSIAPAKASQCELPKWISAEGALLFGIGPDQAVYALDTAKRRVRWKKKLAVSPTTAPVAVHGSVIVGAADDTLWRLDARSGQVMTSIRLPATPMGRIAVAADAFYIVLEDQVRRKGFVAAVAPDLSKVLWIHEEERPYASDQPHVAADAIVVGTCQGKLVGLARSTGEPMFSTTVSGCIRSIGEGGDRFLLVGVQEGTVYAIRR